MRVLILTMCILFCLLAVQPSAAQQAQTDAAEPETIRETPEQVEAQTVDTELQRWGKLLKEGGLVIPVLLVLSVVGVGYILERAFRLRRSSIVPSGLSDDVRPMWREGRYDDIVDRCRQSKSTLGDVIAFVVAHRDSPISDVSMQAGDLATRDLRRHLVRAYPLIVVGTLAPLLGLLGTVSGMVDAFGKIAIAGLGNVAVLGGSISKALVTTMVGLVVAIPALFAYHFFKNRTNLLGVELEEQAGDLIHEWMMTPRPSSETDETKEDDDASQT